MTSFCTVDQSPSRFVVSRVEEELSHTTLPKIDEIVSVKRFI